MKISNSKKELAKIVSENGGWRDGAEWATQDQVVAFFSGGKPDYAAGDKVWCANGDDGVFIVAMSVGDKIRGFHNTILSRAEYFHLYPAQDADGWIEWNGGKCPVDVDCEVSIKVKAESGSARGKAKHWSWGHSGDVSDIIAYRPHKPEQVKLTAVGDGETNLAAKEELEAIEYRESPELRAKLAKIYAPSIESLAADYRNKLEYADRKQDEADKAKIESYAALSELEKAIAAIGFAITPIGAAAQEPELVTTNLLDLNAGDIIWVGASDIPDDNKIMPEGEYEVLRVDADSNVGVRNGGDIYYPYLEVRGWRLVSRQAK